MKWPTVASKLEERANAQRQWHFWYAWRPVILRAAWNEDFSYGTCSDEWTWREIIQRRRDFRGNWEYRLKRIGEDNG